MIKKQWLKLKKGDWVRSIGKNTAIRKVVCNYRGMIKFERLQYSEARTLWSGYQKKEIFPRDRYVVYATCDCRRFVLWTKQSLKRK